MDKKMKKSKQSISLQVKLKILDRLKSGERVIEVARSLNLNESTIRTIKASEDKILKTF